MCPHGFHCAVTDWATNGSVTTGYINQYCVDITGVIITIVDI